MGVGPGEREGVASGLLEGEVPGARLRERVAVRLGLGPGDRVRLAEVEAVRVGVGGGVWEGEAEPVEEGEGVGEAEAYCQASPLATGAPPKPSTATKRVRQEMLASTSRDCSPQASSEWARHPA